MNFTIIRQLIQKKRHQKEVDLREEFYHQNLQNSASFHKVRQ
jgi:hypothetical protein